MGFGFSIPGVRRAVGHLWKHRRKADLVLATLWNAASSLKWVVWYPSPPAQHIFIITVVGTISELFSARRCWSSCGGNSLRGIRQRENPVFLTLPVTRMWKVCSESQKRQRCGSCLGITCASSVFSEHPLNFVCHSTRLGTGLCVCLDALSPC